MSGAAGELQLYLRQPLPAASGLPALEGLCQAGSLGAVLWAEVPQETCSCAEKVSARFHPPSLCFIPQESNHSIKCFLITF